MEQELGEIETAILKGRWDRVQTIHETWTTTPHSTENWIIQIVVAREKMRADGGASHKTKGLIFHLTPELVNLAIEQIDKQLAEAEEAK